MDGFGAIANGITSLVAGSFDAMGAGLRAIVQYGNQALPSGLFWVLLFVALVAGAWTLAKR